MYEDTFAPGRVKGREPFTGIMGEKNVRAHDAGKLDIKLELKNHEEKIKCSSGQRYHSCI